MKKKTKKLIKEILCFLIKFNIFLIPFYLVIYLDVDFYPLQEIFARFIGSSLELVGYQNEVFSFFIYVRELTIDISRDCLGWKSVYSLCALVAASRGKIKEKLKFLGLWIPIFLVFNFLRVLITILIGLKFGRNYLEVFHNIIFQEITILMIVGVWYIWLRKTKKLNREN
jgi:exosortase/archaeosortase family protein